MVDLFPRCSFRLTAACSNNRWSKRLALCGLALLFVGRTAYGVDEIDLVRRQANQRQARAMAREIVSSVLDLQLKQLEENGLGRPAALFRYSYDAVASDRYH